jgi:hypothetical protein
MEKRSLVILSLGVFLCLTIGYLGKWITYGFFISLCFILGMLGMLAYSWCEKT